MHIARTHMHAHIICTPSTHTCTQHVHTCTHNMYTQHTHMHTLHVHTAHTHAHTAHAHMHAHTRAYVRTHVQSPKVPRSENTCQHVWGWAVDLLARVTEFLHAVSTLVTLRVIEAAPIPPGRALAPGTRSHRQAAVQLSVAPPRMLGREGPRHIRDFACPVGAGCGGPMGPPKLCLIKRLTQGPDGSVTST